MNEQPNSKTRQLVAALAVLIVIVAIVTAASLANKKKTVNGGTAAGSASASVAGSTGSTSSSDSEAATGTSTTGDAGSSVSYKDGSYTATSSFDTPGGVDDITVSLTMKNNVVTAVSTRESATDSDSQEYDDQFNATIQSAVVGQRIDQLTLSRVAGASLTTEGFNGAIAQIERQSQNG